MERRGCGGLGFVFVVQVRPSQKDVHTNAKRRKVFLAGAPWMGKGGREDQKWCTCTYEGQEFQRERNTDGPGNRTRSVARAEEKRTCPAPELDLWDRNPRVGRRNKQSETPWMRHDQKEGKKPKATDRNVVGEHRPVRQKHWPHCEEKHRPSSRRTRAP